jgi:alpha-N-arabinofuranosidase
MDFSPQNPYECAGMVLLQNCDYHFRFVVTQSESKETIVQLSKRENGKEIILAEQFIKPGRIYFKVEAIGQSYSFYIATTSETWQAVAESVDGRILSTPMAGGFVGAYLGMYASSNGQASQNVADFDWFEYKPGEPV